MAYQDFGLGGDSKSSQKLAALLLGTLPNNGRPPFSGRSVLDLGCNEGFFCIEAVRQGAKRVVGIDKNEEVISAARARCPDAEFKAGSWWDIPNGTFDRILFLSAAHYEPRQAVFFRMLLSHLAPDGYLILECGVIDEPDRRWVTVQRADGVMKYPTDGLLMNVLLNGYAVRRVSRSVDQTGDSVPRFVYHCSPIRPTAVISTAPSGSGKTVLGKQLGQRGITSVSIDRLLYNLVRDDRYAFRSVAQYLRHKFSGDDFVERHLDQVGAYLASGPHVDEFVALICDEAPLEEEIIFIEGDAIRYDDIRDRLISSLKQRGVRSWHVVPA